MMGFFSRLSEHARQVDSLLCVGLDPHPEELSESTAIAVQGFCLRIIGETAEYAAAFKPNIAFFEAFGPEGIDVLQKVIREVPQGIPVVLDAKRGDIASTALAYRRAIFDVFNADAVTVNPYLGYDALAPFLEDPQKGVFLLCKTSNPGAGDLQDQRLVGVAVGQTLYEHVAVLAQSWNRNDNLGLVVGATHPEALARVRSMAPELWILAPGVGVQGGDLERTLRVGMRSDGLGVLLPVSRSISRAASPKKAAMMLCQEINQARAVINGESAPSPKIDQILTQSEASIAEGLLAAECVQFGEFTLKSGLQSPIYIDMRRLVGYPELLNQVAQAYLPILRSLSFDRIAALPYAALPIATIISLLGNWEMVYPRKEAKAYGTRAQVEGVFRPGEKAAVIDDLATTGGSKFEAIEKLTEVGLVVRDVVVLIDRQSGARETLAARGYQFHAVMTLDQLLDHWEHNSSVSAEAIAATRQFLAQIRGG